MAKISFLALGGQDERENLFVVEANDEIFVFNGVKLPPNDFSWY